MNFTVITDHSALKALKDKLLLTGHLLHRAEKLLDYDCNVIYCASKEHVVPDFLSRIYLTEISFTGEIKKRLLPSPRKEQNLHSLKKTEVAFKNIHTGHILFIYAQLSYSLLFHNVSFGQVFIKT